MAIVFDFWDRAARAYRFDDGTPPGVGRRRRRHAVPRPRRRDRRALPARRRRSARPRHPAQRAPHVVPVPALVRHPIRLPGHRSVPARRRPGAAAARVQRARSVALPVERGGRGRHAVLRRARRVRARRCRPARDRLRDVGDEPRGLPVARRRVRAVRRRVRRARSRSTTTVSTRSRPRPRPRNASCTARSRAWSAAPRSTPAPTCTSRSCGPFAELAGVDLDWTVPRDSTDLYPFLELIDGGLPGGVAEETVDTYYPRDPVTLAAAGRRACRTRTATSPLVVGDVASRRRHRRRRRARGAARVRAAARRRVVVDASAVCPSSPGRSWCAITRSGCRARGSRCAPTGCGASCGASRRSSTGRTGSRRSACGSTIRPTRCAARSASGCRSASTSSGRSTPTRRVARRARRDARSTGTSSSASCTARCCSADRDSSSTRRLRSHTWGAAIDRPIGVARRGSSLSFAARGCRSTGVARVRERSRRSERDAPGRRLAGRGPPRRRRSLEIDADVLGVDRADRGRRRTGAHGVCAATSASRSRLAAELGGRAGSIPVAMTHDRTTGCDLHDRPAASRWTRTTSRAIAGVGLDGDRYATKTAVLRREGAAAKSR